MIWLPGLLVLAAALGAGFWWSRHVAHRASSADRSPSGAGVTAPHESEAHRSHREALLRRKEEIVALLRQEPEAGVGNGDEEHRRERQRLELEAAAILRELDQPGADSTSARPAPPFGAGPWYRRRPMLAGFLLGAASAALVAVLFVTAQNEWVRNAPGAQATAATGSGAMDAAGMGEHPSAPVPEGAQAAEIARLEKAVQASPQDLALRRDLAIALLQADQLFAAFSQAQTILEASHEDFDGRMIMGVVRLAMGSIDEAASHFETAMTQHPENPVGFLYRGLAYQRTGDNTAAVEVWKRGIEAAGGRHPELENLIASAESGGGEQAANAALPPGHPETGSAPISAPPLPAASTPPVMPATPAPIEDQAATGGAYAIHLELAPGLTVPPGAVLFAALRPGPGAPPTIVKRLEDPVFPFDLNLTSEDAMMGGALPPQGLLTLRLDIDGNASTKDPSEPAASLQVELNVAARAVLAAGG